MWGKFSKLFVICLLLLVVSTPLFAVPDWWPGAKKTAVSSIENQEAIQSAIQYSIALEEELNALKQLYSNSQATIAKQDVESKSQKALIETYKTAYDSLKSDYDKAVTQPTVTDYVSPWGGVIGGGVTYSLDGKIGAEILGGVSFKNVTWTTGVEWKPLKFEFVIPKVDDLIFKTGLQYRF